ncbi:hypothetical protein PR048_008152 [Dryococelus australis]|uniref:Uncharacterized protein n=1 Tax=Dryococelus australis TaxID=614101 RepID=A0ABQ9HWA6_9NEOP|nr:hypothetical protein PR048_008152 [Dryococelus australis]
MKACQDNFAPGGEEKGTLMTDAAFVRTWLQKGGGNERSPRKLTDHDSHLRKSGTDSTGNRTKFAWVGNKQSIKTALATLHVKFRCCLVGQWNGTNKPIITTATDSGRTPTKESCNVTRVTSDLAVLPTAQSYYLTAGPLPCRRTAMADIDGSGSLGVIGRRSAIRLTWEEVSETILIGAMFPRLIELGIEPEHSRMPVQSVVVSSTPSGESRPRLLVTGKQICVNTARYEGASRSRGRRKGRHINSELGSHFSARASLRNVNERGVHISSFTQVVLLPPHTSWTSSHYWIEFLSECPASWLNTEANGVRRWGIKHGTRRAEARCRSSSLGVGWGAHTFCNFKTPDYSTRSYGRRGNDCSHFPGSLNPGAQKPKVYFTVAVAVATSDSQPRGHVRPQDCWTMSCGGWREGHNVPSAGSSLTSHAHVTACHFALVRRQSSVGLTTIYHVFHCLLAVVSCASVLRDPGMRHARFPFLAASEVTASPRVNGCRDQQASPEMGHPERHRTGSPSCPQGVGGGGNRFIQDYHFPGRTHSRWNFKQGQMSACALPSFPLALGIPTYAMYLPKQHVGGVAPGFSLVGIVPNDATDRRVFSGISRFPHPFFQMLLRAHIASPSLALKTSILRATQISSHEMCHNTIHLAGSRRSFDISARFSANAVNTGRQAGPAAIPESFAESNYSSWGMRSSGMQWWGGGREGPEKTHPPAIGNVLHVSRTRSTQGKALFQIANSESKLKSKDIAKRILSWRAFSRVTFLDVAARAGIRWEQILVLPGRCRAPEIEQSSGVYSIDARRLGCIPEVTKAWRDDRKLGHAAERDGDGGRGE